MLSKFAEKFTHQSAITQLMEDLNEGVQSDQVIMLGGGNPAAIPEMTEAFQQRLVQACDKRELLSAVQNYDGPGGNDAFRGAVAELLSSRFGWKLNRENIAITNGSQSAFFALMNLYAGEMINGKRKHVLLPMAPEYIGYGDVGLNEDLFRSFRPNIELLADREFKYHPDLKNIVLDDSIGLVCVSRPTNPSGNVITDAELSHLDQRCREADIPLLIDGAYGAPFPGIIFPSVTPIWNENIILCLSLSKLGMPGVRCGIVIASTDVIEAVGNLSGIINLAPSGMGPSIATPWCLNGDILEFSQSIIKPYYQKKAMRTARKIKQAIDDENLRVHRPEGAIFVWLWQQGMEIEAKELYRRLKARGLIVVPGDPFFPGLNEPWKHRHECLRLSYAQPDDVVDRGIEILADELRKLR